MHPRRLEPRTAPPPSLSWWPSLSTLKATLAFAWASRRHGCRSSLQPEQLLLRRPSSTSWAGKTSPSGHSGQAMGHGASTQAASVCVCGNAWEAAVQHPAGTCVPFCWRNGLWERETDREGERDGQALAAGSVPPPWHSARRHDAHHQLFWAAEWIPSWRESVFPRPQHVSKDRPGLCVNASTQGVYSLEESFPALSVHPDLLQALRTPRGDPVPAVTVHVSSGQGGGRRTDTERSGTWNVGCDGATKTREAWDFPGGPVVKTLRSQHRGPGFDPWSGD